MTAPTMGSETACPHCAERFPADRRGGLSAITDEVVRIRELAEQPVLAEYERRVAELSEEVAHLRATVARLRAAPMVASPAR